MNMRRAAMILIVELHATTTGSASLNLTATPTYRARARSFYKEDVESPCSRFNEFLVRAQRLVGRSPTPWQRPRACCFQQLRQHDDHRREMGTRGHIDLWTGRREATERAPCCERDGEDRTRPTKHEKAAGVTRAAFLVSRSVALTTVVPTQ